MVSELEAAIADTGALLVRAQKYRRGAGEEGSALTRAALTLGDRARRLHRHGTLDREAAEGLLGEAGGLLQRARAFLASIHDAPEYRAAVHAYAAGDQEALAETLPRVFAGLEPSARPAALFHAVPWLRRGRLRPVADVTADVLRVATEGLEAEGDDLSAGTDPELPAVVLSAEPPLEEAIVLRLESLPPVPVYRLGESDEYLAYTPRLHASPVVVLAPSLPTDEQLRLEVSPEDYARYRGELAGALTAAGITLDTAGGGMPVE